MAQSIMGHSKELLRLEGFKRDCLTRPLLVDEVQQMADREGLDATEFVAQAVRRHLATYRPKRLIAETEAWYRLPVADRKRYEGEFVAGYNGQVIDSDPDRLSLYLRLRAQYGRQPILITPGGDYPVPVYRIRSPRQGRNTYAG